MKTFQICLLILTAVACASALSCYWKGTAPFCAVKPWDCEGYYWTWSNCGDGPPCWDGYKVYCCNELSPYGLLYWKGTAPSCGASCNDCGRGDECIIRHNRCGNGAECSSGSKVLCGRRGTTSKAELQELIKQSDYTKAKEKENLNMARLMGVSRQQAVAMGGSDPGLMLAYVNYDKIIMEN